MVEREKKVGNQKVVEVSSQSRDVFPTLESSTILLVLDEENKIYLT